MKKTATRIDCVKMKNAIQARLVARRRGMSSLEFIADLELTLNGSKDPISEYWRRVGPRRVPFVRNHAAVAQ